MVSNQKVLLFIDQLGPGGAQRQIVGLAVLLKNKGVSVKVCTYHDIKFYDNLLDEYHVSHVIIPGASSKFLRIWRIYKFFKKERPDCVISYLDSPSVVASIVKRMGVKYHLLVSDRNTTLNVSVRDLIKFNVWRYADVVVPNSYSQEKVIKNNAKYLSPKVNTIPNFVDLKHFYLRTNFERHTIPQIVVAASVNQHKNTLGLIEALKIVIDKGYRCEIKWYGVGSPMSKEYLSLCKKRIDDLQLQDFFFLLNKTKNINEKYQQSDYMCLPSFYEGTSNAICEAMSCGLPLIVSDICDNPYYAKEGLNGFLFDPCCPSAIADSIINAISLDDVTYIEYCLNSRKFAEESFSEDRFVNDYLKLIKM